MSTGNIKNFELKVGRAGIITVVIGMVVLLCAAFLFGVEVGKNIDVYPEKIAAFPQKMLALVWRPAKIKAIQKTSEHKTQAQEDIDLTFYSTLTGKKGSINEGFIPDKQSNFSEIQVGSYNIEAEIPKSVASEESNEKEKSKGKETAESAISSNRKYIVQVMSLKEKNKADKIVKKVDALGFTSQVIKIENKKKGIFYRVIIPDFDNKAQAQKAALKISQKTGINCIIRSNGK
ncbi:MAG: hypothetical protein APR62_03330 [Smithella sp. SDB]|nr:MAG: hypothetical protein APR62_03330 [Smithella sp. SDB]